MAPKLTPRTTLRAMHRTAPYFPLLILLLMSSAAQAQWRGGDLSFFPRMEEAGYAYKDEQGVVIQDVAGWMVDQGMNLARLRIWHNPANGPEHALPDVLREAIRFHEAGMDILIDFHFSDTWADPGAQHAPAAWADLSFEDAKEAMACWVECTMKAFTHAGVDIAMVQLGNETDPGMMHPHGTLDDGFGSLASLLQAGHEAVTLSSPGTLVAVHVSSIDLAPWYFTQLQTEGYTPDVIAISNYSLWHETDLEILSSAMASLSTTFNRPTFLAETAYAWTIDWYDWTHNLWWTGAESDGYPFTPQGQLDYLTDLDALLTNLGPEQCLGWCYWAPDWVSAMGPEALDGSPWENAALWDFDGVALPAWAAFQD